MDKVAVIGLGSIAKRHRRNLKSLFPHAAVLSMSSSGRKPSEQLDNSDGFIANIQELIDEEINLAIVASPGTFHAKHSIPLIQAGIPLLIEKPISASVEDATAILKAIETHKTPVAIGYCLRYLPSAHIVKDALTKQSIGAIHNIHVEIGQYLPFWRPDVHYKETVSANAHLGGGALLELSHELDYAQWLFGPLDVKYSILRSSEDLNLAVEDIVDIVGLTKDKSVITLHLDFIQKKARRCCSIVGSQGRIDWDLVRNEVIFSDDKETRLVYSEPSWDKNKLYLLMLEDFVKMIESKEHGCCTAFSAVELVSLINGIKSSADKL